MSKTVKAKGQDQEVKVEYGYSNDRLTRITHNGFNYGFGYDEFGKTRLVAIAGSSVVSYEYEEKNGKLLKTKYANGDSLRYEYDTQGRLVKEYYYSAATQKEQALRSYGYDREGNVYRAADSSSGKTYKMSYDFLNRLMRVRDEKGNAYQYTYDANNNMTQTVLSSAECMRGTVRIYSRSASAAFWDGRNAHQPQTGAAEQRIVCVADGSVA